MRKTIRNVLLAATLVAIPAHAAGVDPASATAVQREQAQQHFLKGKDRYDRNDMNAALDEFRASLEIVASPNARLYVARTLREMGRLVEAYVELGRTAADAKEHEREDGRYGKAATAALAERDAIAPQIGFVQLTVKNASDTTTVTVGGNAIVRAGCNDPIPVKPGNVDIVVATPGAPPVEKTPTLHAGQKLALEVDANEPAKRRDESRSRTSRVVARRQTSVASSRSDRRRRRRRRRHVDVHDRGRRVERNVLRLAKEMRRRSVPRERCGRSLERQDAASDREHGARARSLGFCGGRDVLGVVGPPAKSSTQRASAAITFRSGSIGVAGTF